MLDTAIKAMESRGPALEPRVLPNETLTAMEFHDMILSGLSNTGVQYYRIPDFELPRKAQWFCGLEESTTVDERNLRYNRVGQAPCSGPSTIRQIWDSCRGPTLAPVEAEQQLTSGHFRPRKPKYASDICLADYTFEGADHATLLDEPMPAIGDDWYMKVSQGLLFQSGMLAFPIPTCSRLVILSHGCRMRPQDRTTMHMLRPQ